MMRSRLLCYVITTVVAVFSGGCSLVVDFDRALLVDAGTDGGVDAGFDAGVDAGTDAAADARVDAR
jgi:hypothetical protein